MSRRVEKEEAAHLQYETEHTQPPKSRSVIIYLVILIAAAFCLLLLAYIMQERTASTVEGLSQSVNSFQTIDQLVDDNRALQDEIDRLKEEQAKLESELLSTKADAERSNDHIASLSRTLQEEEQNTWALNTLNQLRALYNNGNYKAARALIDNPPYDGLDLETILGRVSDDLSQEELERYDPLASYRRIVKLLGY